MYYLGIDLGGTNIAAGVINEKFEIIGRGKVKTRAPRPAAEIVQDMYAAGKAAVEDAGLTLSDIHSIGVGAPGTVDPETGVIGFSNNLDFHNEPIADMLKTHFGKEVYINNDANVAAYGEFLAGCGVGTKDFIAITLGTGVGGGVIIDGKIFSGMNFAGAELGHVVIANDGAPCTCGRKGCWESYASATGLIRQTKEAMEKHPDSKMWEIAGSLDKVNGLTAFDAMRAGDAAGAAVTDQYIEYIACGITNVINIFQPEILCIGGGISAEGDNLLKPIRAYVEENRFSKHTEKQTVIKKAELGNDAGIIGAACLYKLYE